MTKLNENDLRNNVVVYWAQNIYPRMTELADTTDWYHETHEWVERVAKVYGYDVPQLAAIVAVLSQTLNWESNREAVFVVLEWARKQRRLDNSISWREVMPRYRGDMPTLGGAHPIAQLKAIAIAVSSGVHDDNLAGEKVTAFYDSIMFPEQSEHFVVDRHMKGICGYGTNRRLKGKAYRKVERVFMDVAEEVGLPPAAFHSVLWSSKSV